MGDIYLIRFYDELDELDKESDEPVITINQNNDTLTSVREALEITGD
jgi:hypothetical protein